MLKRLLVAFAVCGLLASGFHEARAATGPLPPAPVPGPVPAPVAPWVLMACPALIVVAAFVNFNRQLTA